ncbi:OmpH family outer membrane protein [Tenuifilum thalassicum]|uniref:OmpH family outer membrane protein n=1 Tax=Tenuifilum thalassicum TaxID=2590900 RepID=A0A7D4BCS0_9BACT|nr:OmpH family outer membrane protein [Tenuifilum thalassicum]QKG79003.1 OmpH family outer membrane protein [Tenuifilum thalassicum]
MRKILTLVIIATLTLGYSSLNAQNYKFGHINSQELLNAMPDKDSAEAKIKKYAESLQEQIEQLQVEFNKKYQDYLQKRNTFTDAIREMKEKELSDMQQRAQEYQQVAEQDYQRFQAETMKPVIDKADAAIKKVAKENGFTYIFDTSSGVLLYFSDKSIDITPLVKKELGIKE